MDGPDRRVFALCVDIMFVDRDPYFLSVSSYLGLLMVTYLQGRSASTVWGALSYHISAYRAHSFEISAIL
jgi:hypothetical protein